VNALADRLTTAAAYVAQLPDDLPDPTVACPSHNDIIDVRWHLSTTVRVEDQRTAVAAIRRAIGGTWDKQGQSNTIWLTHTVTFEDVRVELTIFADREQVCRRVVTGTETVTVPAVEAQPERVEEREIVTWECDPITADERVAS